jgi:TonB family protein
VTTAIAALALTGCAETQSAAPTTDLSPPPAVRAPDQLLMLGELLPYPPPAPSPPAPSPRGTSTPPFAGPPDAPSSVDGLPVEASWRTLRPYGYMNALHQGFHDFFAKPLAAPTMWPQDSPLNDPTLRVVLRIVIDASGRLARVTVLKTSGNADYDAYALQAVRKGSPYPAVPPELLSSNGRFYVDWAMNRETTSACSTLNARPLLLGPAPAAAPPNP